MSTVLADLGGTHFRLARAEDHSRVQKFKISDYPDIETPLRQFAPDISALYLASAIHPRAGIIEDKRFGDKSHWTISLDTLKTALSLQKLVVLNDLEAATYSLPLLRLEQLDAVLLASDDKPHFENPPRVLVGIGTGIGHAYLFEKTGHGSTVQRSHGGHIPALALSDEQKDVVRFLQSAKTDGRDLIVEDIVSGTGFQNLIGLCGKEKAIRLFWEFLGLYCNALVSVCGAYGGVYLTGGMVDELSAQKQVDAESFKKFFIPRMVPVVAESLSSTPVYYCKEPNMPILGLSLIAGASL